jgi:energy-coupling factor transporter ATP-binding protein EcfA2
MHPFDRQNLVKTLSSLPAAQFEQLLFAVEPPDGILPAKTAPQGERTTALLGWAETTGPGLKTVHVVLYEILGKDIPVQAGVCPYKGLSYFDCNDQDYHYFYGREALTKRLLEKVAQSNFLVIVGASGSGKSSVLRAGLLQRLKDQGDTEIRILVPGEHPLQNLALAFVDENLERLDRAAQQQKAQQLIQSGAEGLTALVQTSDATQLVLVVDQFEEAFTLCQDSEERQQCFATLLGALAATSLRLIVAMRADFVGKCFEQEYSGLAELVQRHLEAVLPMTPAELTQAITAPAKQAGLSLEPGLVETLLKDVASAPGSLPLLQYTLKELWQRRQDNQLKLSTYAQLGGVTGTLKQRADQVYDDLTPEQQQTAKHIFLNLTQLGEGAEDTRRRISQTSLIAAQHPMAQVAAVVKQLADANLVVTDERVGLDGQRSGTVDVAHEALIRNWPKLRQWLDENRDLLRQQRKIELAAQEWNQHSSKIQQGYLLQGRALIDAQAFRQQHTADLPLSELARDFIQASRRQQRRTRLKTASWLVIPAVLILGVVDYNLREAGIKQDYERLDSEGTLSKTEAAADLVAGCREKVEFPWLGNYLSERLFGHCRSLANAPLAKVHLSSANLIDADLRNADLIDADLIDADLSNANLHDTRLGATDLRGVTNLTLAQLTGENSPYLCKVALPSYITDIDPDRDCAQLLQLLMDRKGLSPEQAERWVNLWRNPAEANP